MKNRLSNEGQDRLRDKGWGQVDKVNWSRFEEMLREDADKVIYFVEEYVILGDGGHNAHLWFNWLESRLGREGETKEDIYMDFIEDNLIVWNEYVDEEWEKWEPKDGVKEEE